MATRRARTPGSFDRATAATRRRRRAPGARSRGASATAPSAHPRFSHSTPFRTHPKRSASLFNEVNDANTFANDWQIDMLKYDACIHNLGVALGRD